MQAQVQQVVLLIGRWMVAGAACVCCCRLQDIPGASVEHNNFCVSAHFRNCATENWQRVVLAVNDSVAAQPAQLHVTRGRKVLEVRPQVRVHAVWQQGMRKCTWQGLLGSN
jgi:trehalose 6-phosphate phosphatase